MTIKLNNQDISVKLVDFTSPHTDNQSLMMRVNPDKLETVYDPNFWPKRIAFETFQEKIEIVGKQRQETRSQW